jgi:hypothetical protein
LHGSPEFPFQKYISFFKEYFFFAGDTSGTVFKKTHFQKRKIFAQPSILDRNFRERYTFPGSFIFFNFFNFFKKFFKRFFRRVLEKTEKKREN